MNQKQKNIDKIKGKRKIILKKKKKILYSFMYNFMGWDIKNKMRIKREGDIFMIVCV